MILEQHYLGCLAQASYFIADESSGTAVVVDPRRDIDLYLEEANKRGLRIEWVILTHFHADFLAGHLELREATGAKIALGRAAQAEYEFTPLAEGDEIVLGDEVRLSFLETPGHTPESICILVHDLKAGGGPKAVLTGDTLFIGDVGRPDLMASVGVTREELATKLYHSLRDKLLPLDDEVIVYPGHGAGSACGKALSSETWSTIGKQREFNYALADMEAEEFVRLVTTGLSEPPAYFAYDAALNKKERATLTQSLDESFVALDLDRVLQLGEEGAQLVDTRCPEDWEAATSRLSERGLLDGRGGVTEAGQRLRDQIEHATDRIAVAPYVGLSAYQVERTLAEIDPMIEAIANAGEIPFPNPMGLPDRR